MDLIKKESKFTSPKKHILINDAGIGSNRLVISNNYLNNYNYYNKNNIKMLEFRKMKYLENKLKSEEYKREKSIPKLLYTTSYYINVNKTNNDYIQKDKNNYSFKKAEINYLSDLIQSHSDVKLKSRKNRLRKTYKVYDDLIKDLNNEKNKKEEIYDNDTSIQNKILNPLNLNYQNRIKNCSQNNEFYDESLDYKFNNKNNNVKCKVIFGKTLSSDYKYRINLYKNRKINYFIKPKKILIKNNQINLKKNLVDSNYSKYLVTNINHSDREKTNRDLISISLTYFKNQLENNQEKNLKKDNSTDIDKILPLIK